MAVLFALLLKFPSSDMLLQCATHLNLGWRILVLNEGDPVPPRPVRTTALPPTGSPRSFQTTALPPTGSPQSVQTTALPPTGSAPSVVASLVMVLLAAIVAPFMIDM